MAQFENRTSRGLAALSSIDSDELPEGNRRAILEVGSCYWRYIVRDDPVHRLDGCDIPLNTNFWSPRWSELCRCCLLNRRPFGGHLPACQRP